MRLIVFILGTFLLAGCESDFDKCFEAEQSKITGKHASLIAEQQAVYESHPVIAAALQIEAINADRWNQYSLEWETVRIESEEALALGQCEGECDELRNALESRWQQRVTELNLDDVESIVNKFTAAIVEDAFESGTLSHRLSKQVAKFAEEYSIDKSDPVSMSAADRAWFAEYIRVWKEALTKEIEPLIPEPNVPEEARELCNSRGLYE